MANPEKKLVTQFTVLVRRASLETDYKHKLQSVTLNEFHLIINYSSHLKKFRSSKDFKMGFSDYWKNYCSEGLKTLTSVDKGPLIISEMSNYYDGCKCCLIIQLIYGFSSIKIAIRGICLSSTYIKLLNTMIFFSIIWLAEGQKYDLVCCAKTMGGSMFFLNGDSLS